MVYSQMLRQRPLAPRLTARRENCLVLSVALIALREFISRRFYYAAFFGANAWRITQTFYVRCYTHNGR